MNLRPAVPRPAENPFSSGCIDTLAYRFRDGGIDSILERLGRNQDRGAIVGRHGSGKTTLLEQLADRLEGEITWVRLNADHVHPGETARRYLPEVVDQRHVVLIDGAEQLGRWSWWRLHLRIRHAGTIIITSHHKGRLPALFECTTSPELLKELVSELVPDGAAAMDLEHLYERRGGNIRLCFRELYDVWAGR